MTKHCIQRCPCSVFVPSVLVITLGFFPDDVNFLPAVFVSITRILLGNHVHTVLSEVSKEGTKS